MDLKERLKLFGKQKREKEQLEHKQNQEYLEKEKRIKGKFKNVYHSIIKPVLNDYISELSGRYKYELHDNYNPKKDILHKILKVEFNVFLTLI